MVGAKVGDVVALKTKGMFNDDHDNEKYLGVAHEEAHGLDIEVSLKIEDKFFKSVFFTFGKIRRYLVSLLINNQHFL